MDKELWDKVVSGSKRKIIIAASQTGEKAEVEVKAEAGQKPKI